jgi:hypothetical protein
LTTRVLEKLLERAWNLLLQQAPGNSCASPFDRCWDPIAHADPYLSTRKKYAATESRMVWRPADKPS